MKNVGNTDRLIRLILGLGLIFGGYARSGGLGCVLTIIGLVVVYSGMTGRCFFYSSQGINTCPVSLRKEG